MYRQNQSCRNIQYLSFIIEFYDENDINSMAVVTGGGGGRGGNCPPPQYFANQKN